jgi:hypothetical protein
MRASIIAAICVGFVCGRARGGMVVYSVADVTVNALNPDSNLNTITTRGGLLSGLDNLGSDYRFFLKFSLGGFDPQSIGAATLIGTYTDDFKPAVDSFHQLYFVTDDAWDESAVTWNTMPALGDATAGSFDAIAHSPGDVISFDVTAQVKREAAGDRVASFALATIDGRFEDLEYFASREFDPARAFRIQIDSPTVPPPGAIPLPAASVAGAVVLAATLLIIAMRNRRPYAR